MRGWNWNVQRNRTEPATTITKTTEETGKNTGTETVTKTVTETVTETVWDHSLAKIRRYVPKSVRAVFGDFS